jgi:hypothetical protein
VVNVVIGLPFTATLTIAVLTARVVANGGGVPLITWLEQATSWRGAYFAQRMRRCDQP